MNTEPTTAGTLLSPPICSADPFPKWKWMMDYCKSRGMSPTLGWDQAEKAWRENNEPNTKDTREANQTPKTRENQ